MLAEMEIPYLDRKNLFGDLDNQVMRWWNDDPRVPALGRMARDRENVQCHGPEFRTFWV
jgi:hypothetical protein